MNDKLLVIAGPTAVGKTAISIELAKKLNGEIISTDSMQIYKYMDIGSAKISTKEMDGVKHHLIDFLEPSEEFSVSDFQDITKKVIEDIRCRGKLPILTGGTGLYINSIICTMNFAEGEKDDSYRQYLHNIASEKGNEYLHSMLKDIDEDSYNNIHPNNLKRVIRALEVYKSSGKPFSSFKEKQNDIYKSNDNVFYYVLNMDRENLYERINLRVDMMIDNGLIEECKFLKNMGLSLNNQSMKGIGYKEIIMYLNGDIDLKTAVDMVKQGSRNYAKRQLTWFRKDPRAKFINKDLFDSQEDIINMIIQEVKN